MTARRLLGVLLPLAVAALAVAPPADAAIFERFKVVDEPYAFEDEFCGIEVEVEGTSTASGRIRAGTGRRASAFFERTTYSFTETWTAANGLWVTLSGHATFTEVKAEPLGGTVFRFTAVEAGRPFDLYDPEGNLVLSDRGAIRFGVVFDTLGDATPGGVVVEELEPSVHGPHPGFDDESLCPVLVPLLTSP